MIPSLRKPSNTPLPPPRFTAGAIAIITFHVDTENTVAILLYIPQRIPNMTTTQPLAEFLEESYLVGITDESLDAMMSDTAYWAEYDTACDTFDRMAAVNEFNAHHEATN